MTLQERIDYLKEAAQREAERGQFMMAAFLDHQAKIIQDREGQKAAA